jgi:hypothetical protein
LFWLFEIDLSKCGDQDDFFYYYLGVEQEKMAANGGPHGTPQENGDGGGKHKRGSHKRGNSLSEGMSRLFFGLRGLHGGGGGASGGAGGSSEERAPTSTQQISSSSKAAKKAKRGRSQSSKDRTSSSPSSSPSSSSRDKIKKRSGGSSAPTWDRIEQPASQPPSHHQVRIISLFHFIY